MKSRALAGIPVVLLPVGLAGGCGLEAFAVITLAVREPAAPAANRAEEFTHVSFQLDEEDPKILSFAPGSEEPRTPAESIPLGRDVHSLLAGVSVGDLDEPTAVGFSDPLQIPAIEDPPEDFRATLPLIVAAPDRAELLDRQRPTPRSDVAVCMDDSGKGWFIGGLNGDEGATNGYAFSLESLLAKEAVLTQLRPGAMACDGDGRGGFVLLETTCLGGRATGTPRLSVGRDGQDIAVDLPPNYGCAPFVSVIDDVVWVATAARVEARSAESLDLLAAALSPEPVVAMVGLTDERALVAAAGASTTTFRLVGESLVPDGGPAVELVALARAQTRAFGLDKNGTVFSLNDEGELESGRVVHEGAAGRRLGILRDGRAVVLTSNKLYIEGGGEVAHAGRDGLGVTVGGAVLLVGGGIAGTDVVVPNR